MIIGRKKPVLPDVVAPLTQHEVEAILSGPNGRNMLRELRESHAQQAKGFAFYAAECEKLLEFNRRMLANSNAVMKEIDRALGRLQA